MSTKNMTHEQISAFADGESADNELDAALAALRTQDGRVAWDLYHQIGDTLRSADMAMALSPDFASRLTARLEDELAIVSPSTAHAAIGDEFGAHEMGASAYLGKRFFLRGMAAAAAVAAVAFVAGPQLLLVTKSNFSMDGAPSAVTVVTAASANDPLPASGNLHVVTHPHGEVLRNSDIDEYLLAHQRFSPSVYSTAQYARSATFAIDSDK
jgi:sigma-E factor negative regulatory protein RseA